MYYYISVRRIHYLFIILHIAILVELGLHISALVPEGNRLVQMRLVAHHILSPHVGRGAALCLTRLLAAILVAVHNSHHISSHQKEY